MANEPQLGLSEGRLPSVHQLRAALRAARLVDPKGSPVGDLHNSYRIVPSGGIYRSEDMMVGEKILFAARLLRLEGGVVFATHGLADLARAPDADGCEALLLRLLGQQAPLWLLAATSEPAFAGELVPDDERRILDDVLSPEAREELLMTLGRRFAETDNKRTGDLAEEFLVGAFRADLETAGRPDIAEEVRQVSKISDQLGYDITAPRLDRSSRRIEAKGTRSSGSLVTIHLSRNEAERATVDPDWHLVACHVSPEDDTVTVLGWLHGSALVPFFPSDPQAAARWESVRIELPVSHLREGLPHA